MGRPKTRSGPEDPPTLAWLAPILATLDLRPELVVLTRGSAEARPLFKGAPAWPTPQVLDLPETSDGSPEWIVGLRALLRPSWSVGFLELCGAPPRSVEADLDGVRVRGGAAVLLEALRAAEAGRRIVTLAPAGLSVDLGSEALRRWIADRHEVSWLIQLGSNAAEVIGAHSAFRLNLLILRAGSPPEGSDLLHRLVDLRQIPFDEWPRVLKYAATRKGGEREHSIVLRGRTLDGGAWTYERFSRDAALRREDAERLGPLQRLGDFVESIRPGLSRPLHKDLIPLETEEVPAEYLPCYGGRNVQIDGRVERASWAVRANGVDAALRLRTGDLLIRALRGPREPLRSAQVPAAGEGATFDSSCLRIRWRSDVSAQVAELLTSYLAGEHARQDLDAAGSSLHVNIVHLQELLVPKPAPELLLALQDLSRAEERYQAMTTEVQEARKALFAAKSFREQVPALLLRRRMEVERLAAAEDALTLDYSVRNRFPHPIALRREQILHLDHGEQRLDEVLRCAEHLMHLLALLALLQQAGQTPLLKAIPGGFLRSLCQPGSLVLQWGACFEILREGVAFTRKHMSPLELPFPELAILSSLVEDSASPPALAEAALRRRRNDRAHLRQLPARELQQISRVSGEHMDEVLTACEFLVRVPLVRVVDCVLDPVSRLRTADFEILQGTSPAFRRERRRILQELPREDVGFLDHRGQFQSAAPWLTALECPTCKRREVFMFDRLEQGRADYVAIESGHSHERQDLAPVLADLIRRAATSEGAQVDREEDRA